MGAVNSLATFGLEYASKREKSQQQSRQQSQRRDMGALREQRSALQDQELAEETRRKSQELLGRAVEDRRQADLVLKRRLAQERARAGAAGVSARGGSIDAVLSGLVAERRAAQAAADADLKRRLTGLQQTYEARRRRSLLDEPDEDDSRGGSSGSSGSGSGGSSGWLATGARALASLTKGRGGLLD